MSLEIVKKHVRALIEIGHTNADIARTSPVHCSREYIVYIFKHYTFYTPIIFKTFNLLLLYLISCPFIALKIKCFKINFKNIRGIRANFNAVHNNLHVICDFNTCGSHCLLSNALILNSTTCDGNSRAAQHFLMF